MKRFRSRRRWVKRTSQYVWVRDFNSFDTSGDLVLASPDDWVRQGTTGSARFQRGCVIERCRVWMTVSSRSASVVGPTFPYCGYGVLTVRDQDDTVSGFGAVWQDEDVFGAGMVTWDTEGFADDGTGTPARWLFGSGAIESAAKRKMNSSQELRLDCTFPNPPTTNDFNVVALSSTLLKVY